MNTSGEPANLGDMSAIYDSDGCLVTRDPVKVWQDAAKHGLARFPFKMPPPKGKKVSAAYHRRYYAKNPERREYHRQYMRELRATFHANGLNSQGKPYVRNAARKQPEP